MSRPWLMSTTFLALVNYPTLFKIFEISFSSLEEFQVVINVLECVQHCGLLSLVSRMSTHLIMSNPWTEEKLCKTEILTIAGKELREDESTKKQCLEHLKEWVHQNQDIENCFTDDVFLLRFLRIKKFSIPMAQQTLLKYLNFRKRFEEFMYDLDYRKSSLINDGYVMVSPFRDSNGRRVIIYNLKKVNPHEITGNELAFAHAITYETLLADEENQILGLHHVVNMDGFGAPFLTLFPFSEIARIIRWGEQSIPMRHKEINVLNFPASLKYIYELGTSNLRSQKLKDRILFHASTSELHNKVNKNCLPEELGGKMPAKEMLELWKKELAAKRDLLLSYDKMKLLSDRGIICRRNAPSRDDTGLGSLPGSFRKLEVD